MALKRFSAAVASCQTPEAVCRIRTFVFGGAYVVMKVPVKDLGAFSSFIFFSLLFLILFWCTRGKT